MQKKKKVYMNCLNVTKGVLLINETGVKAWACNDMIKKQKNKPNKYIIYIQSIIMTWSLKGVVRNCFKAICWL